jgi:hypothetical protein
MITPYAVKPDPDTLSPLNEDVSQPEPLPKVKDPDVAVDAIRPMAILRLSVPCMNVFNCVVGGVDGMLAEVQFAD